MCRRRWTATLLLVVAAGVPWCHAQELNSAERAVAQMQQPDEGASAVPSGPSRASVEALARAYWLTSADGARRCEITLSASPTVSGFALALDRAACAPIAFTGHLVAWVPDDSGAIRLVDAKGHVVAEFTGASEGSFEALREGDGVYFLGPPVAARAEIVDPAEVVGDWVLWREGPKPVCRWRLTDQPAAGGGSQVLIAPECDVFLVRFAPSSWQIVGGNVLVKGATDGSTIRFARQEDGTWARIPERSRPLHMTRP